MFFIKLFAAHIVFMGQVGFFFFLVQQKMFETKENYSSRLM